MITKVYELTKRTAAYFETKFCGRIIKLEFTSGRGSGGSERAELVTSDVFTQDAIEHDPRYGVEFIMTSRYGEKEESEVEKLMRMEKSQVAEVAEPKEEKKSRKKKAVAAEEEATVQSSTEVAEVVTLNDAFDYFAEKGVVVEGVEQLESACAEYGVSFPNLEVG